MQKFVKNIQGFTLMELLVVISIISVLASVAVVSMGEARKTSRDKVRKIDVEQIQLGMRLYLEQNGSYPGGTEVVGDGTGVVDTAIVQYLGSAIADPLNRDTYVYQYDGSGPEVCAALEEGSSYCVDL